MELELLKLFFPEELVAHFDITGSTIKQGKHGDYLEVEFTERNELPAGISQGTNKTQRLSRVLFLESLSNHPRSNRFIRCLIH